MTSPGPANIKWLCLLQRETGLFASSSERPSFLRLPPPPPPFLLLLMTCNNPVANGCWSSASFPGHSHRTSVLGKRDTTSACPSSPANHTLFFFFLYAALAPTITTLVYDIVWRNKTGVIRITLPSLPCRFGHCVLAPHTLDNDTPSFCRPGRCDGERRRGGPSRSQGPACTCSSLQRSTRSSIVGFPWWSYCGAPRLGWSPHHIRGQRSWQDNYTEQTR